MHKTSSNIRDRTVIQVATQLVDSVTDLLFEQISHGNVYVDQEQTPLKIHRQNINISNGNGNEQSLIKSSRSRMKQVQNIDVDQHKKMIKKFISMNKRLKRNRELRSMQMSERSIKIKEDQDKQRQSSRNKILQQRRKQIQRRMEQKKNWMKQIQKSALNSNSTISQIRKKKFLYQQKQQQYYSKVVLPKLQQQQKILNKKKQMFRKPMDLTQIKEHERSYEQLRLNSRVNRSLTISVIKSKQTQYRPPQYVSQAYKKAMQEEETEKLEEQIKKRQMEINQIRKKQLLKKINELRQKQLEISKQKERPLSAKKQQAKLKMKPQLNRQQQKNVGNQYLKELLASNRKYATAKKLKPIDITTTETIQISPKKIKSQYQIEIIRQQRIERVHKIRARKIHQLMKDKHLDEHMRQQKLKHEIEKLDLQVEHKLKNQSNNIQSINESAMIMMNAIQAKMALLGVQIDMLEQK